MQIGDLVKRRGQEWYAIVIGFKTDLGTLPCGVELGPLPPGNRSYPIFMWVKLDGDQSDLFDVQSCSASLLEVVASDPDLAAAALEADYADTTTAVDLLMSACKTRADMV